MAGKLQINTKEIFISYSKSLLFPGYIIKSMIIIIIFEYPILRYITNFENFFEEIYYLFLYSVLLIPLFDFPIITLISLAQDKTSLKKPLSFYISKAIGASFLVFLLTVTMMVTLVLILNLFY